MIHAWLDLPVAGIFASLVAFYGLSAAAIYALTFHSPAGKQIRSLTGVAAPFFGAIAVLFSLLTGFLGAEVAERGRQASRSVLSENNALLTLDHVSRAAGLEARGIRVAARDYLTAVLNEEWATMTSGEESAAAAAALEAIQKAVASPAIAREAGNAVQSSLLSAAVQVAGARADRLSLAEDRSNELKWVSVLILCFLTQVAIGLVHVEKPRAMLATLALFSIAAIVAIGLIALQENPFEPPLAVSNAPLAKTLKALSVE